MTRVRGIAYVILVSSIGEPEAHRYVRRQRRQPKGNGFYALL